MSEHKTFLKIVNMTGGLAVIAQATVVAIKDWAIDGTLCCQITYMAGDIPMFVYTYTGAAEVWAQVSWPVAMIDEEVE